MTAVLHRFIAMGMVLATAFTVLRAQSVSPVRFDDTAWNFGRISEDGGKVKNTYTFTNVSPAPVVVDEVVTTCGCAVASFSREPVMPGRKGSITVTFDPRGLTSSVNKTIKVSYNGGSSMSTLSLRGQIDLVESVDLDYPYALAGGLYTSHATLFCGRKQHRTIDTLHLRIFNNTTRAIEPCHSIEGRSGCVKAVMPKIVPPKRSAGVVVVVSPPPGYYGHFNDLLYITVGGAKGSPVRLTGIATEFFRPDDKSPRPAGFIATPNVDLGQQVAAGVYKKTVTLLNKGSAPLIVRKIENSPHMVWSANPLPAIGGKGQLSVELTITLTGGEPVDEKLYIITNDPVNPMLSISLTANNR